MSIKLTLDEKKLVEYAKKAIVKYNKMRHQKGSFDALYSFLMSDTGKIHGGACFEPNIAQATICGERHAIANMIMNEAYKTKIKHIVIADPVPKVQKNSTPPCGTCRHLIWQFGTPKTSVILMQYILQKNGWIFPKIEKYFIKDLYPYPYEPKEGLWD
jgi:cytidine deaminase